MTNTLLSWYFQSVAIAIVPGSAKISGIRSAQSQLPTMKSGLVNFAPLLGMHADGEVKFSGSAGDSPAGWQVGWIQAQWIETNWAEYRGRFDHDGGIFLQRGRAPARPAGACRDTSGPVATIFTDPTDPKEFVALTPGPFPVTMHVQTNDPPGEGYRQIEINSLTHKPNFLHEIQLEFHFCTVLTVRDPANRFHHQAHFLWNIHWQVRFRPTAFPHPTDAQWTITPVAGGNRSHASIAFPGGPTEHRFTSVLTSPQSFSCVDLANRSTAAVGTVGNACRREFTRWHSSDVRK